MRIASCFRNIVHTFRPQSFSELQSTDRKTSSDSSTRSNIKLLLTVHTISTRHTIKRNIDRSLLARTILQAKLEAVRVRKLFRGNREPESCVERWVEDIRSRAIALDGSDKFLVAPGH